MQCTLCESKTVEFSEINNKKYFRCVTCDGILLDRKHFLSPEDEKRRYLLHQNDVNDPGYQEFVLPLVQSIIENFDSTSEGLDFGSGSGPVITTMLREKEYTISTYDPFFDLQPKVLERKYDYIICCEVIEHFYNPKKEFDLLYNLLKPGGSLYCKTKIYYSSINFGKWWYKNDPTHVFFYSEDTMNWIAKNYSYQSLEIHQNISIFKK
ncbi:class I SAM-dependent methyltransferase [Aquimarina sp. D1M17]|uniref:class I SAM-dependent methyltransferase n=1 Tax=Aquimarina acroporae TaxID=2937283 RepID=UPI0020BD8DEF|nr:class I SAM-dependent methyltransferase [Aquimarina acroporae]MCK8522127.1 class I SAM-dependent methyltransferase [Aquimarina acroporae]